MRLLAFATRCTTSPCGNFIRIALQGIADCDPFLTTSSCSSLSCINIWNNRLFQPSPPRVFRLTLIANVWHDLTAQFPQVRSHGCLAWHRTKPLCSSQSKGTEISEEGSELRIVFLSLCFSSYTADQSSEFFYVVLTIMGPCQARY